MAQFERRKFLGLPAAAVIALWVRPCAGAAHITLHSRQPAGQPGAADPLLEPTIAWLGQLRRHGQIHLLHPVSRLQREFLIGYNRTCALADSLARCGEWTIAFSADGTRYARIHARVAA
jgi:hypothetical protein